MKKLVCYLGTFILSLFCGVFLWDHVPCARKAMQVSANCGAEVFEKSCRMIRKVSGFERLRVFERKFSAEQILNYFPEHVDGKVAIELTFVPHTLMSVRFSQEDPVKKTMISKEGKILWNLSNGEMVLNTGTWSCSKGLRECLLLKAGRHDVSVMQALANLGGAASKESLSRALSMKNMRADKVIKSCQKKKLIFSTGSQIGSHFQQLQPIQGCTTEIPSPPVWLKKPRGVTLISPQFSEDRVCNLVEMIFGDNFLILSKDIVYVPIYKVLITATDNSERIEYINAVTGKPFYDF
ncbi:hypothetical protein BOKEGFJH_00848 [Chlamydia avium]|uniref:Outer membrane protein n=2 Tax=Chlamydia avium TaxID=1457141 RepID=W8JN76_9CHLA|nr:hypothetical protein [Chlamydia avium]AHK63724.1 Putative outer membrane protein [Chlamydia avium 10DC88]EPP36299.1 putative outer membrane protein [Chlamydia psittaci 10_743_SC13]EPP38722.1 putative outer membrane protein [Chlamydia avium]VVT43305.1 hypothetical protein BOKEGFJH_00848 [Chlamydia avium]